VKSLVIDASVWVAAIDPADGRHRVSAAFLRAVTERHIEIVIPAIARRSISPPAVAK
jgi:predicted nucleic acid-binding protein